MKAGKLLEYLQFLKPVIVKTDTGSEELDYKVDFSCRGEVQHRGGTQTNENGDVFYSQNIVFNVRRFYDFNENYRIQYAGHTYRITYIQKDRSLQRISITAELINDFDLK